MSNSKDLLPKDKHDFESVYNLKRLDRDELTKIVPELLEWLQDINWPIANEVSKLLLTIPHEALPFVNNVLAGQDDLWKEWCLRYFVIDLPVDLKESLREQLERIAHRPTKGEELEEVHITAQEILEEMND